MMVYRLANICPGCRTGAPRRFVGRGAAPLKPRFSEGSATRVDSVSPSLVSAVGSGIDRGTGVWQMTHRSMVGDVVAPQYVQSIGWLAGPVADYRTVRVRTRTNMIRHPRGR